MCPREVSEFAEGCLVRHSRVALPPVAQAGLTLVRPGAALLSAQHCPVAQGGLPGGAASPGLGQLKSTWSQARRESLSVDAQLSVPPGLTGLVITRFLLEILL